MEKKQKYTGGDLTGYLLLGISVMMLGKSLMLCFSSDIWYDELFTVGMIEHSYGELIRFTAADVHPPLYYCIVKLFSELCKLIVPGADTVVLAKLASILPYGMLILYSVTFIRRRFGMLVSGLFSFCILAMPQLSAYTVEVRMYGWAMFFVTAAFLHAGELVRSYVNRSAAKSESGPARNAAGVQKSDTLHAAALVLYGLAAAYTQYFACVAVGMVYLYVLIGFFLQDRSRIKVWLVCLAVSVAGYAPWLAALAGQLHAVGENYWILPLTWRSLGGCVKFLMKPAFTGAVLSAALAVVLTCGCSAAVFYVGLKGWRDHGKMTADDKLSHNSRVLNAHGQKEEEAFFVLAGVGVLAGLVAFGFLASFLFRPVFVYRYMIPAAGCFWLSVAVAVGELCKPKEKTIEVSGRERAVRTATFAFLFLLIVTGLRDYRAFMGEEEYKIVCMRETQTALAQIGPDDSVLYNFDQVQAVTGYYLPETADRFLWRVEGEKLIQEITTPCGMLEDAEEIRTLLKADQGGNKNTNLWFIGSFNSRDDIVKEWRDAGLAVEERGSFLLERYWFNLYKISLSGHTV
ncbi:MAG: hypothetical protein K2O59_08490 [Lachnospiraceae bacterium]|nr:hypothetical protein [Lachnospiraceae bacterium]